MRLIRESFPGATTRVTTFKEATGIEARARVLRGQTAAAVTKPAMATAETSRRAAKGKAATRTVAVTTPVLEATTTAAKNT